MAVFLADTDTRLKHQGREWNARNPSVKGKCQERAKEEEDYSGRIILLVQIEDGGTECKDDVEDASHPDKRLGKHLSQQDVHIRENHGGS